MITILTAWFFSRWGKWSKLVSNELNWVGVECEVSKSYIRPNEFRYEYKVYTQGIHTLGSVSGLKLANNSFDTSDIHPNYASDAILSDTRTYDSFGWVICK